MHVEKLQPPFYLKSEVCIFSVIFLIRVPSKLSIVFLPHKPLYSQTKYSPLGFKYFGVFTSSNYRFPNVDKNKGVVETIPFISSRVVNEYVLLIELRSDIHTIFSTSSLALNYL